MNPDSARALQVAAGLIQKGLAGEALPWLQRAALADPREPDVRLWLGQALWAVGDPAAAERELRVAVALDKRAVAARTLLGELLLTQGQAIEGERILRNVLAQDRRFRPAVEALARYLLDSSRADDALKVLTPLTASNDDGRLWGLRAEILIALGRSDEAIAALKKVAGRPDADAVAQQNLAAALVAARRHAEGETAARRAISGRGGDSPTAMLLLGQALQGLGRFDEAESAYRQALASQDDHPVAHRELAQLVWMRTENVDAATEALTGAIRRRPGDRRLRIIMAKLLEYAGDRQGGYDALAPLLDHGGADPALLMTAAQLSLGLDADRALIHAERALNMSPDDPSILAVAAEACLAAGQPDRAASRAEALQRLAPHDQQALGLLATAWRLLGDPRYAALHDYEKLVRTWRLDTPEGWPSLEAWLADLSRSLEGLHGLKGHPVGQSLRHGSQTSENLEQSADPAVAAFFSAIDGPVRRHIEHLGRGRDPIRSRVTGRYRLSGSWSVRLRPGGRHVNHLHPGGWLSSAAYIALPDAIQNGREGWISFGEPGVPTRPVLEAEHWVRPEPGMLVLFPSYMWHGTAPFSGDQPRLTCAFDVLPS